MKYVAMKIAMIANRDRSGTRLICIALVGAGNRSGGADVIRPFPRPRLYTTSERTLSRGRLSPGARQDRDGDLIRRLVPGQPCGYNGRKEIPWTRYRRFLRKFRR